MAQYPTTPFERAVDRAIADANRAFLNDPDAQAQAAEDGLRQARAIEATLRGFVQKPYPEETLDEFAKRAGTDTWHPRDGYTRV